MSHYPKHLTPISRPLRGILVADFGQVYNGPYCAYLLAELGARVIKIEPPGGDIIRERVRGSDDPYPFLMLNSDKESVVIDLKTKDGLAHAVRIVDQADVLVENFTVGVMDRLGLGWGEVARRNPRLIYASGKGYGSTGPYAEYPAMDLTVQAMSGVMDATGHAHMPPTKCGPAIGDFLGGAHLAAAVLAALYERELTGVGRRVEVSMHEATIFSLASALGVVVDDVGRNIAPRTGNRHPAEALAPYNVYSVADGSVALICVTARHWKTLTTLMGRPELADDPRFATTADRATEVDAIDEIVSAWMSLLRRDEAVQLLTDAGVPAAPVLSAREVYDDRHLAARRAFVKLDHTARGTVKVPSSPLRLDGAERGPWRAAPLLGEHTGAVLAEFSTEALR